MGLPGPLSVLSVNTITQLFDLLHHPVLYGTRTYSTTDSYFADYPKDIKLVGFSWNLTGPDGIAIQGEVSHRFDQPVQLSGADLSLGVNAPAVCYLAGSALFAAALGPSCAAAKADPVIQAAGGVANFNSELQGWVRRDVTQAQDHRDQAARPDPLPQHKQHRAGGRNRRRLRA